MGFDRRAEDIISEIEAAIDKYEPVESVFKRVALWDNTICNGAGPTAKVLNSQNLIENEEESQDSIKEQFKKDLRFVNTINDARAKSETTFFLMQKYGSRLCAAQDYEGKFSLFDNYRIDKMISGEGEMLLLKGDFSGIQQFIYGDIGTDQIGMMRQVARELRGKSFFVSMLTDLVAEQFLAKFELNQEYLLFAGGGHFNILVPHEENTLQQMQEFSESINRDLPDSLSLTLIYKETSNEELKEKAGEVFDAVNRRRDRAKYSKFSDDLSEMFAGKRVKNKYEKDIAAIKKIGGILPKVDYILQLSCKTNDELIDIDKKFKPFYASGSFRLVAFTSAGKSIDKIGNRIEKYLKDNSQIIATVKILSLNNTKFLDLAPYLKDNEIPVSYAFRFIGKYAPESKTEKEDVDKKGKKYRNILADFTELSKTPPEGITEESKKNFYTKLAFLRLDIDDLGAIFSLGQKKNNEGEIENALKHTAVLSRELNLFFAGHFNVLAKKHHCYIVYSGGDDAFAVGSWLNIIHFVKELRADFKKFTAHNSDLHFSAGIFTCTSHYPVAKAAKDTGKLEERAKAAAAVNIIESESFNTKDRICIFNHTLKFSEFVKMTELGQSIMKYTAKKDGSVEKKLTKSLVYKVLDMIKHSFKDVIQQDSNGNPVKFKAIKSYDLNLNRVRIHNLFARHGFTKEYIEKTNNALTKDVVKILLDNFSEEAAEKDILQNYTVALNYVLFNIRKPKE